MAVTAFVPGQLPLTAALRDLAAATFPLKVMLATATYTPNQDTHVYVSSVTNEVAGTGYTAGGATVANAAATYDAATNVVKVDGDDPSWPASTITARYAIFYVDTGTPATSPIVAVWDFGQDEVSSNGAFTLQLNAAGIATVTAGAPA